LRASFLSIRFKENACSTAGSEEDVSEEFLVAGEKEKLKKGLYSILYVHPEALISCPFRKELMHSGICRENVCAIVVDECHCILAW
jgi:hypothetical protein